jgi:hypothetical protein
MFRQARARVCRLTTAQSDVAGLPYEACGWPNFNVISLVSRIDGGREAFPKVDERDRLKDVLGNGS